MVGLLYFSLILEATIPIIPSCQLLPVKTKTGSFWKFLTSEFTCSDNISSMLCLSLLDLFKSFAIWYVLWGSSEARSSAPWEDLPTLPPAFILGPKIYPKWYVVGWDSILHKSYKVFKPKFNLFFNILSPCVTIALFKSTRGTTSHTVPRETKSKKFKILGSLIFSSSNQFLSLNFLFKATKNIKHTPAAQR